MVASVTRALETAGCVAADEEAAILIHTADGGGELAQMLAHSDKATLSLLDQIPVQGSSFAQPARDGFEYLHAVETDHLANETWDAVKAEIRALLIRAARRRSVIPYSEVTAQLKAHTFDPEDFRFHRLLGEISAAEDDRGRGLLTVIVVHKWGDMRPGPGFFELAAERGRPTKDLDKVWLAELDRVWGYWSRH